ncbi:MAG TPA: M1 family aminopeptidase [Pyrinomonadaceae bacterium]|jgi:aminopeptidase N
MAQLTHSRRRLALLLLLLQLLLAPASLRAQTSAAARQAPALPAARNIPAHDYDLRHVKLDLCFDWAREQAAGTAALTLAPLAPELRRVEFDAANMSVSSVQTRAGAPLKYELDERAEKLRVELERAYRAGEELTVVVAYRTRGNVPGLGSGNYALGLVFNQPTADDPLSRRQIYSQGESEFNRLWFPSYDHPNDFATSELSATVERPLTVVSNGRLIEVKENPDDTRTFHWLMEQPHANYLTSIVVGEYAAVEDTSAGVPVTTYVYPNELAEGRLTAARLADMVRFFAERTGVKYPYAKYAQAVVHNFPGGMENISATTQSDTMIHDARTELDQSSDPLQAHELAHQWFGDMVTCRDWADLWLNEGFATYFEGLWNEHRLGRDEFLYADVRANQNAYLDAWARGLRRPLVTRHYRDPEAVFDVYPYQRGAAVLHMLRFVLGEENWWRALKHYLTKHAHQPVETAQLRIAIEEATGQPLDWFFDEWVYRMGHPVFRVTKQYDEAGHTLTLNVRQEQTPDPASAYPQTLYFQTPVEIEIGTASGARVERVWLAPRLEQSFNFKLDGPPLLVNFDYGRTLIKELRFDKPTDELVYQLAHDADVLGRTWALAQLRLRLRKPETNEAEQQTIATAIAAAVTADKFWGVRAQAADALAGLQGANVRAALSAAAQDERPQVRAAALGALGESRDKELAGLYERALSDPSYAVVGAAAEALGQSGAPGAYDALTRLLAAPSWRERTQAAALAGLAATGDRRALDVALKYAAAGHTTDTRKAALRVLGATGQNDPRVLPVLMQALRQSFVNRDLALGTTVAETIYRLDDPAGLRALRDVLALATKFFSNDELSAFAARVEERLRQKEAGAAHP